MSKVVFPPPPGEIRVLPGQRTLRLTQTASNP